MIKKPKKKPTKTYYRNKLDKKFSEKIREKGYCEISGVRNCRLECAHIYSRRYVCIRWDKDNALCLSSAMHRKAHDQPLWFAEKVKEIKGKAVMDKLKNKTQNLKAITIPDMQKIYLTI